MARHQAIDGYTYTTAAAAYVAGLSEDLVKRWVRGNRKGKAVLTEKQRHESYLHFLDVVELLALHDIRKVRHIPLQRIRETMRTAAEYGITHPFAMEHETSLFEDHITIKVKGRTIFASGGEKHQHLMKRVIEPFVKNLSFDTTTGLADKYVAMQKGDFRVELNARRGFGHPLVQPVGNSVAAIVHTVETEGSVEKAARMLEIPRPAVELAVAYDHDRRSALQRAA